MILRLTDVGRTFGTRRILSDVNLSLGAGEGVRLVGPSGLGKSTLLEIAAGLLPPSSGLVERRGGLAIAFQDDALLPWTDATDNLAYALSTCPGGRGRIGKWLERFELPARARPSTLSGGMRRRLALARAFAAEADLTLLDEPFAFLDARWRGLIARWIDERAAAGGAVVHSTHQVDATPSSTIRTLTLDVGGRLVEA